MRTFIAIIFVTLVTQATAETNGQQYLCIGDLGGNFSGTLTINKDKECELCPYMQLVGKEVRDGEFYDVVYNLPLVSDGKHQNLPVPFFTTMVFNKEINTLRINSIRFYEDFTGSIDNAFTLDCTSTVRRP